jgi:hypothetical protein
MSEVYDPSNAEGKKERVVFAPQVDGAADEVVQAEKDLFEGYMDTLDDE